MRTAQADPVDALRICHFVGFLATRLISLHTLSAVSHIFKVYFQARRAGDVDPDSVARVTVYRLPPQASPRGTDGEYVYSMIIAFLVSFQV